MFVAVIAASAVAGAVAGGAACACGAAGAACAAAAAACGADGFGGFVAGGARLQRWVGVVVAGITILGISR